MNDCCMCKNFEKCYDRAKECTSMNDALVVYFSSMLMRDYCLHNDRARYEKKRQ